MAQRGAQQRKDRYTVITKMGRVVHVSRRMAPSPEVAAQVAREKGALRWQEKQGTLKVYSGDFPFEGNVLLHVDEWNGDYEV